ncbi:MAG: chalcone isomerase family protein [Deltaproteobacteria bacterium]|nr:chalcone isomerase family protein [Deltaproteobacteria bacterium]
MTLVRAFALLLVSLSLAVSAPAPAQAAEHHGVSLADNANVAGKAVQLNGAGLRSVLFIKVYVIGFWTEKKVSSTADALASGAWKAELHMLRGLEPAKITDGIQDGFSKNSASEIGALQARLDTFKTHFVKVSKGDVITLAWEPGKGTVTRVNGAEKGTIEGKDFADALLKVWLGGDPVQDDIKSGMLGG